MKNKYVYDKGGQIHFLTFSCYKRRKLLSRDRCKAVVLGVLAQELRKQHGKCLGFVIMPNHVHALLWFPQDDTLSAFVQIWKQKTSVELAKLFHKWMPEYGRSIIDDPVWQRRFYDFNVISDKNFLTKLDYMHNNPVKAGFVSASIGWRYSSARHYELGSSIGVPIASLDDLLRKDL